MRIIDIGVCIDNNDPKGLGRVRYKPYNLYVSEIEKSLEYTAWGKNDQFIAFPFLPAQINIIPKLNQSIQLIKYDSDKDTQNVAYVTGPFGSPHDQDAETFLSQHKNTTFGGVIVKDSPDLRDISGEYIDKRSKGSLAKLRDNGVYGNYGSDVIFTIDGLFLRGGKYITKETPNKKVRQRLQDVPLVSEKVAKIFLKKFPKTMAITEEETSQSIIAVSKVKYIVEYSINDLLNPTELSVYVYQVLNTFGQKFDTNVFNETTEIINSEIRLINELNSGTTPTFTIAVDNLRACSSELREVLYTLDQNSLFDINIKYPQGDLHPFYFRPTPEFKTRILATQAEKTNRSSFINSIAVRNTAGGRGLSFSKNSINAPVETKSIKTKKLKVIDENQEQTFSATVADKLYLLSTKNNKGPKNQVDFTKLDQYEYTQLDYLDLIEPNTYSIVRGEVLIKVLRLLYEFSIGHVHNINDTGIYIKEKEKELSDIINALENDLLNQSIKIN
jgi:hypothetical protein